MTNIADRDVTPIAITDDLTAMADYVRSSEVREAVDRGLSDIQHGRLIEGKDALSVELKQRAAIRRA